MNPGADELNESISELQKVWSFSDYKCVMNNDALELSMLGVRPETPEAWRTALEEPK